MMTGYLFDRQNPEPDRDPHPAPLARRTDPVTSYRAAALASRRAPSNRWLALQALAHAGERGMTDFELAAITGVAQTSIGVRRGELVRAGYVIDTRETRAAPSGAQAAVWRITTAGYVYLARARQTAQEPAQAPAEQGAR